MSLAKKFRLLPVPGYGVCGGRDRSCVFENLDPMDKLFYKHDHDLYKADQLPTQEERDAAYALGDAELEAGLRALTEDDMKKIPFWSWKRPFFRRNYARVYRKAAIAAFKD